MARSGFKYFLFSPNLGKWYNFDEPIFQMGWFNHQLDGDVFFLFFEAYTPLKIDISPNMVGRRSFPFEMVPFQVTCIFSGGGFKVLWRFDFSRQSLFGLILADSTRFIPSIVSPFCWGQKRWEHWEIVIMDSSRQWNNNTCCFQPGNTTLYLVLGLYLCCVLFYVLSSLFVFLAGLMRSLYIFFLRGFGLFDYLDSNAASITPAGWCHLAFFTTQLQILSG